MRQTLAIARKELEGYFGSPMALMFVGAYLAVTLFSFFWVDAFFARGIADVRPLWRWTPLLMIFLISALTMRQWSEEQRSGTLEVLLTLPVSAIQLVVGKFLAVMALVAVALALTLFLPITVSTLGNLDWGPVFGGYLAALLLAAAYGAIGLFVSSRTDNQIVALLSTVLICGLFYLAGSSGVIDFVGGLPGDVLRAIGSGSHFQSIERGVVDLRDLVYYLSLTGVFLTLNVVSLDAKRWSRGRQTLPHRRGVLFTCLLVVLNLVFMNVWTLPLHGLRLDLTAQREYSLSPTTYELLGDLQEPLVIRGYFSEKTHPLLAPLVPSIRDMLQEYQVASGGKIDLEIIDPAKHPEEEAEANQTYGIQPMPFQVAGRYETSIINSYFHILIRYGDQNVVLGFQDLIEVESHRDGTLDVRLRNLEYDLTSAIKKVVYGFQSVDAVLAALSEPAHLTAFITPQTLPESIQDAPATIEKVAQDIADESNGKFTYEVVDPDAAGSSVTRQDLYDLYGLQPFATALFSADSYYLDMVLQIGDQTQLIYPPGDLSEAEVRNAIEAALKRASPGFLQVVGLWTPPQQATPDAFGQMQQPLSSWQQLRDALSQEYEVRSVSLGTGVVPTDVDVLVIVAPQDLTDRERFAIDQYLMRGGSVVAAAGNYAITVDQTAGGLGLRPLEGGLDDMLASYGFRVENSLVMDPQNEPFPVPVIRNVGNFQVQEIQAIDYPFFVDVRSDGMASDSPVVSNLPAVTLNWASPVTVDEEKNADREVTVLLRSSPASWTESTTRIQPDFQSYPSLGFPVSESKDSYTLAVAAQGVFESYFRDKPSPLEGDAAAAGGDGQGAGEVAQAAAAGTIEASPGSARLILVGSAEFVDDVVFEVSSSLTADRYLNSLKLMQNAVAWSVEDLDLLSIRSRGNYARVLAPMTESDRAFWEGANYVVALAALVAIGVFWGVRRRNEQPMELMPAKEYASRRRSRNRHHEER